MASPLRQRRLDEDPGIDGLPSGLIETEVQQGANFVMFQYCISVLVMTFKRPSDIYYIRPGGRAS